MCEQRRLDINKTTTTTETFASIIRILMIENGTWWHGVHVVSDLYEERSNANLHARAHSRTYQ